MSERITQKIEAPDGWEFDKFDEETLSVDFRPVKKVKSYEVERVEDNKWFSYIRTNGEVVCCQAEEGLRYKGLIQSRNYDAQASEMILARDKFKLDRKLRIAENEENLVGWVASICNPIWTVAFYHDTGWKVVNRTYGFGWAILGTFATKQGAQNFLDSLTDDEKETMLKYWRVKV